MSPNPASEPVPPTPPTPLGVLTPTASSTSALSSLDSEFTADDEHAVMTDEYTDGDEDETSALVVPIRGQDSLDEADRDEVLGTPMFRDEFPDEEEGGTGRGRRRKRRRDPSLRQGLLSVPLAAANVANSTLGLGFLALPHALSLTGLPLGIVLISLTALLSAGAHIVLVNTGRYLGVRKYEDVGGGALAVGARGKGLTKAVLRVMIALSGLALMVSYLLEISNLLHPVLSHYSPSLPTLHSRAFLTLVPALLIIPFLYPRSFSSRLISRLSVVALLTYPVLLGLVAARSTQYGAGAASVSASTSALWRRAAGVEVLKKHAETKRGVWGGISLMAFAFASQQTTFPHHRSLRKSSQRTFNLTVLIALSLTFALSLPFAIVPYLSLHPHPLPQDIFARLPLPGTDAGVDAAHVLAAFGLWAGLPFVLAPAREAVLRMGRWETEHEEAGTGARVAVSAAMWLVAVPSAVLGGVRAKDVWQKVAMLLGLALGYLLPALFFIILHHVRRPRAIVISASDGLASADALLAHKERQLQRRRTGRRLWQDLFIFTLMLPVGLVTVVWQVYALFRHGR